MPLLLTINVCVFVQRHLINPKLEADTFYFSWVKQLLFNFLFLLQLRSVLESEGIIVEELNITSLTKAQPSANTASQALMLKGNEMSSRGEPELGKQSSLSDRLQESAGLQVTNVKD